MIVFFDTSVHVALMRGNIGPARLDFARPHTLRLSPVVAHELLRGARAGRLRRAVEHLIAQLVPIEPPSWREAWLDAGRVLRRVFERHEEVGLARLQSDSLIAVTAQRTGALLVTRDRHFEAFANARRFAWRLV